MENIVNPIIEEIRKLAIEKLEISNQLQENEEKISVLVKRNTKLTEKVSNEVTDKQLSTFTQIQEIVEKAKIDRGTFNLDDLINLFDSYSAFKNEIDSDKKLETQADQLKRLRTKKKKLSNEIDSINNKLKALFFDCMVGNIQLPEDIIEIKNAL